VALAARERSPGSGAIVVDFGTALSISVVSPDGAFTGGLIAAGGGAILRGLEASTPRLPKVPLAAPGRFRAEETVSALQAGVYWEVVGGVRAMLQGLRGELPGRPRILATGGEASLFAAAIPEIDAVEPDLVLEGLEIACRSRGKS
jgi:type III pantothenate kinase